MSVRQDFPRCVWRCDVVHRLCYVLGPQGSILGPLFFILYMPDLADRVARYGVSLHAYADDTQL